MGNSIKNDPINETANVDISRKAEKRRCKGRTRFLYLSRCKRNIDGHFCADHKYQPFTILIAFLAAIIFMNDIFGAFGLKKPIDYLTGNTVSEVERLQNPLPEKLYIYSKFSLDTSNIIVKDALNIAKEFVKDNPATLNYQKTINGKTTKIQGSKPVHFDYYFSISNGHNFGRIKNKDSSEYKKFKEKLKPLESLIQQIGFTIMIHKEEEKNLMLSAKPSLQNVEVYSDTSFQNIYYTIRNAPLKLEGKLFIPVYLTPMFRSFDPLRGCTQKYNC